LLQDRRVANFLGKESVVCEPALPKGELNRVLDASGRWLPVDPSSYATCSVGGMVANNSSGSRSYKYRSTIDYVEELRVVLPEEGLVEIKPMPINQALAERGIVGRVARLLSDNEDSVLKDVASVTKNSSGYRLERVIHDGLLDLPRLFVGSEGTLGIVTSIKFRTRQKPRMKVLLIFETSLKELDRLVAALRVYGPSAIELLDKAIFEQTGRGDRIRTISRTREPYVVFSEFDSDSETLDSLERVAADPVLAGYEPITLLDPGDVARAWEVRNETLTIAADMKKGSRAPVPGVEDLVVPPMRLGDLIKLQVEAFERRGLDYISYGHAGDANLHMRPLLDSHSASDMRILQEIMAESFEAVWKMGGSITGEHGDGMLRAPFVKRQYPHSYEVMREVKSTFDPKGILNPGVKIV
jgi:FAD/FMN-containing dehydrogenase